MIAPALFRSDNAEWETPRALFARLDREFAFTLDVCATRANHLCAAYFTPEQDGLRRRWTGACWMNPPYGRSIGLWVEKAHTEGASDTIVVSLLPARTDTSWWHDHVMKAREIRLLRGRLTFVGATSPAPFPSAVVIFGRGAKMAGGAGRVIGWDWKAALPLAARTAA
jgi:phage N-6-adenine-methyltransferase